MAVTLDLKLWFDDADDASTRFVRLVECVSGWAPVGERTWQPFVVRDAQEAVSGRDRVRERGRGGAGLTRAELERQASQWHTGAVKLSASTGARVRSTTPSAEEPVRDVALTIDSWGAGWLAKRAAFGPRSLVGDAVVWLQQCWPYLVPRELEHDAEAIDANVAELLELAAMVAADFDPASMKVFTEVAPFLPVDAHAVYVRTADDVLDDLRLMHRAWREGFVGCEALHLAAPASAFHEWRGADASARLHAELDALIDAAPMVTREHVAAALRSERLLTRPCGPGVLVYGSDRLLDGWADELYLEALRQVPR